MDRRTNEPQPLSFAAETEYLITDVEELVNKNINEYLKDQPFRISITDYTPEMPVVNDVPRLPFGINRIDRDIVQKVAPGTREFIGMDLLFDFPIFKATESENPLNIALKWSGDISTRLAVVDKRPLILVENGPDAEHILYTEEADSDLMRMYLESIGLPASIWSDDFKFLMADIDSSRDIKLERHAKHLVDIATTLEISHDARFMTNDDGDKELVQELCLNIDHEKEGYVSGLQFKGETFRNMFRFERNEDSDSWKYRGSYSGKLVTGEFIDKLVQDNPKLGIPGSKLLEKALNFLDQPSDQLKY